MAKTKNQTEVELEGRIREYKEDPSTAREYLQSTFKDFLETMFFEVENRRFVFAPYHDTLIALLEEMVFDEPFNLLVNVRPRSGKSEIFTYFDCWAYALNPMCNNGLLCYSDDLVSKNSKKLMEIIQSPLYKELFDIALAKDMQAKSLWKIKDGGEYRAVSMDGAITGFGGGQKFSKIYSGMVRISDPQKPQDARSEVKRNHVIDLYKGTIKNRRNDIERTPLALEMQRVDKNDLSGFILDEIKYGREKNWKTLIVPSINDDGTSFFPKMFPIAALEIEKNSDPFNFEAQNQQNPQTNGGNVIKIEKFKRYKELPPLVYTKFFADTAMTKNKASDYTAIGLFGYDSQKNCYLIDIWRGKWESPDVLNLVQGLWDGFHALHQGQGIPRPRCVAIENRANGIHLIQEFRRRKVPVGILEPKAKDYQGKLYVADKTQRLEDVLMDIEAGFYYVPHDSLNKPWMPEYMAECQNFTRDDSHAHDDQVDITIYALQERQSGFIHPDFLKG
jgi:phage uncharacterized protein (putative large terminase), C-terminal domain